MTPEEYQAFLADPLHQEFVQEHERRMEHQRGMVDDIMSEAEKAHNETQETLASIDMTTEKINERVYESRGCLADIRNHANDHTGHLRDISQLTGMVYERAGWTEEHTEAANIWHAIQTLVLIAGFAAVVASQRGWW